MYITVGSCSSFHRPRLCTFAIYDGLFLFQFLQTFHLLLLQEFVYAAQVFAHAAMTKFIYLANEAIKKVAVVAYHDKGAIKVL